MYDKYAEELSFPAIYYGEPRKFKENVKVTEYMKATSEIRRKDRRGVTPQHVLYMAMKIMRYRVVDSMQKTFKNVPYLQNITRKQIEDRQFYDECAEKNFAFLKSIPNSMVYWQNKRNNLFAMIRQLGKPTCFLTMSANETKWPHLLVCLHKLNNYFKNIDDLDILNALEKLNRYQRSHLVNEDPVLCCLYFQKLVNVVMAMLQSKQKINPFGKYRVVDYFLRIEFQHRGSPHAHILLWLANDPKEQIGENMCETIQLINDLSSVSQEHLDDPQKIANQVHKHTFTCFKRGEEKCRFNIPYWPMNETRIFLPMAKEDNRKHRYQQKAIKLKKMLEERTFVDLNAFLFENNLTVEKYYNIIRSTLRRPTVCFKRNMQQVYINTFHPWLASILNSNMDLQFILEEYSCAQYVVEYVNKSNRGISHLHREMLKLHIEHPDAEYTDLIRKLSLKLLNNIEMSAQEAAWFLLRQPMCKSSREITYIPTIWPQERYKSKKLKSVMDREGLDENSTDIWTKTIFMKYEERTAELNNVCLADFVAWYSQVRRKRQRVNEEDLDVANSNLEHEFDGDNAHNLFNANGNDYIRRAIPRIIRYRHYSMEDSSNYKREMVTLFLPFRNELVDILDNNKFLEIFDTNEEAIMNKKREYEANINIEVLMAELRAICENDDDIARVLDERQNSRNQFLNEVNGGENNDDLQFETGNEIAVVKKRTNVMSKQEYCECMRLTNPKQRELILEFIHRLCSNNSEPIQVYLAGPAGSGKTFTMKLIMETVNRFGQQQNQLRNAYLACASTGKAAVNLNGVTVHSAFRITPQRRDVPALNNDVLQQYHRQFSSVRCVIIDEISMIGSNLFQKVNSRLQQVTGVHEYPFGNLFILLGGDFKQLSPVMAKPIYKGSNDLLGGNVLWHNMCFFNLTQVMRQADVTFSTILTKIGSGEKLLGSERRLIEDRFRTKQWCQENVPSAIRIFHRNAQVDIYNNEIITSDIKAMSEDKMTGYSDNRELVQSKTKLHKMSTAELGGLPYLLNLCIDAPYMLTVNINLNDGLVNGIIGTLKFIEYDTSTSQEQVIEPDPLQYSNMLVDDEPEQLQQQNIQPDNQQQRSQTSNPRIVRLWIEFPNKETGQVTRVKNRPHVHSIFTTNLSDAWKWTPITKISANFTVLRTIKCRRFQFPLVPAASITIHKSQGATFDQLVYDYDKTQMTQLVYVALSRVTNINGLFITNSKNKFQFYHAAGSNAPSIKEIKDEYARLEMHILPTITSKVKLFISQTNNANENFTIIAVLNSQSLVAHVADIQTDDILKQCHYLAISETWMNPDQIVQIQGFQLITQCNSALTSNTRECRRAGGVAIYKNILAASECRPVQISVSPNIRLCESNVGDICLTEITLNMEVKFIFACVYFHPNVSQSNKELLLFSALMKYSHLTSLLDSHIEVDPNVGMLVVGDFNTEITPNCLLSKFMLEKFNLNYMQNDSPTTTGGTIIDLLFQRNLNASIINYLSYFSYHYPVIAKISH